MYHFTWTNSKWQHYPANVPDTMHLQGNFVFLGKKYYAIYISTYWKYEVYLFKWYKKYPILIYFNKFQVANILDTMHLKGNFDLFKRLWWELNKQNTAWQYPIYILWKYEVYLFKWYKKVSIYLNITQQMSQTQLQLQSNNLCTTFWKTVWSLLVQII